MSDYLNFHIFQVGTQLSQQSCIEEFIFMENALEKSIPVDVYSSVPLTDEQKEKLVKKLENKLGKTVIVLTHDMSLIQQYKKRVVQIENGKIVSDKNGADFDIKDMMSGSDSGAFDGGEIR